MEKLRADWERPRISDQFADLKAGLSAVSYKVWSAIPGNRKACSNMPVLDSLLGVYPILVVEVLLCCCHRHRCSFLLLPCTSDAVAFGVPAGLHFGEQR
jgi:hypothetical protein